MGYDLSPKNKIEGFHFGAFSWLPLIEACGCLFTCIHNGPQWYCVFGADKRMPKGDSYPKLVSNHGFKVTAEEAKIMARIARNLVAIQRSLPDEHEDQSVIGKKIATQASLSEALMKTMTGTPLNQRWPVKLRKDFVDKYEQFAEWAVRSGGFKIY